jgi:hypothetical protein
MTTITTHVGGDEPTEFRTEPDPPKLLIHQRGSLIATAQMLEEHVQQLTQKEATRPLYGRSPRSYAPTPRLRPFLANGRTGAIRLLTKESLGSAGLSSK